MFTSVLGGCRARYTTAVQCLVKNTLPEIAAVGNRGAPYSLHRRFRKSTSQSRKVAARGGEPYNPLRDTSETATRRRHERHAKRQQIVSQEDFSKATMSYQQRQYPNLAVPRTRWDLKIEKHQDGMPLHAYLLKRLRMPAAEIDALLSDKRVVLGGNEAEADVLDPLQPLQSQQTLTVTIPAPLEYFDAGTIPLDALVDDGVVLAINKQPGVPVQPRGDTDFHNILSALHARYRSADPALDKVPHLAHRLDVDTSGMLLILFDRKLTTRVQQQFAKRQVQKEYLAVVHGCPEKDSGSVDCPVWTDPTASIGALRHLVGDAERGKEAVTDWEVEERFNNFALIRFKPKHGRTHQIRIHALHMGHPILCDYMYGGGTAYSEHSLLAAENTAVGTKLPIPFEAEDGKLYDLSVPEVLAVVSPALSEAALNGGGAAGAVQHGYVDIPEEAAVLSRCALHSASLRFKHPTTAAEVTVEAPLTADIAKVVELLKANMGK